MDLRSDTLTLPSEAMRSIMCLAPVGDDCYGEDPSVRELELRCAAMFGKESALLLPTGTMSNQIAVKAYTSPGDEVITEQGYHLNFFESGQVSVFSGVCLNPCATETGLLAPQDIEHAIARKFRGPLYAQPRLLFLENAVSNSCGIAYAPTEIEWVSELARSNGLDVHLDGARILHACIRYGVEPKRFGETVDSLSLCLAKGLGCPMGSVLLGSAAFVSRARVLRKWFGGAMHQAGFIAAAALHALAQDWRTTLARDHAHAEVLASGLKARLPAHRVQYRGTNMVMVSTSGTGLTGKLAAALAQERGLLVFPWGAEVIRLVTHQNFPETSLAPAIEILAGVLGDRR
jgi:threonine aldolase